MALDENVLANLLVKELNDRLGENQPTPPDRLVFCQSIAKVIIEYLKKYAEVEIPTHDAVMDEPAGAFTSPQVTIPPHRHLVDRLHHKNGKII